MDSEGIVMNKRSGPQSTAHSPQSHVDSERWAAVVGREAEYDEKFWYGVMTTGVYCRPSCAARRAKRENVRFFDSTAAARSAGLRPCKRCKPDQERAAMTLNDVLELCRYMEKHADAAHSLTSLAKRADVSQFQLHRAFKAFLHVTPKQYLDQLRLTSLKKRLRESRTVTDAIYDSGFESSSALYGRLDAHLGMTPRRYRQGGKGVDISFAFGHTPLGRVLIGATDRGVCYLQFGDSDRELLEQLASEYPSARIEPSANAESDQLNAWLGALNSRLEGSDLHCEVPLDVRGTAFQKRVWDFLQKIPAGDVYSYGEVARAIGEPRAVRAVASACARNRIGVLIPCHRVIRGNGELGGYRWGLTRKRAMLDGERRKK
jgi:AraC family transcriptional regulator, regulatory protein of adaptative response / methylated-DNA-[protein]-cysteine methyltransferase